MNNTQKALRLRPAAAADRDTLVRFNLSMASESEDKTLDEVTLEKGVTYLSEHPDEGFYLVAELDGTIAGALMVTYEWSDWRNGRFWWIQSVYVDARYRRRGVYSALHEYVKSAAKADPRSCGIRLYVEKDNTAAQATYHVLEMQTTSYLLLEEVF